MKKHVKWIAVTALVLTTASALQAQSLLSFGGRNHHAANYTKPEGITYEDTELADGVYQGTATGFRPGLTVEVSVEEGALASVEVVSHNEIGPQYYTQPIRLIPNLIVKKQSTDVDSVSGATATSSAIKSAVEDALKGAVN